MLPAFNTTTLVLIPKGQKPSNVADFKPISYCSVNYKCVTKILVRRLTPLLPNLISPRQSAFGKGRSISDNSLLAHEFRGYGRGKISARCALKVDLKKALIH
ncbi:hypothetical protein J1N35_018580 [Gossypium stocksii]|uniref:Reverse transcriptase domain-containing protein n=1 Tax=Gossypium stocksii TaxID=47602 RepID=A0A9D3VRG8_9ROSI|nr:hypothetical protein J1N35_018580 [Gossypium stocksii]